MESIIFISKQTGTSNYFESPLPVYTVEDDRSRVCYLIDIFLESLSVVPTPSVRDLLVFIEECEDLFDRMNFFEFYFSMVEKCSFKERMQDILKCEYRKNTFINACIKNIDSLESNSVISDSYVKSFLAFFGKSEEMFDLYKSKDYKKFAIDSFLEVPIFGSSMLLEYTSGDLLSYFVMERRAVKISQIYRFFCSMESEAPGSNVHWLKSKEEVTRLKPLQLLGIVRGNLVLRRVFLESMQNPDKKQVLMEININPLLDQMDAGSITIVYVLSFLSVFRVQSAYQFFVKAKWDKFLSAVVKKRTVEAIPI